MKLLGALGIHLVFIAVVSRWFSILFSRIRVVLSTHENPTYSIHLYYGRDLHAYLLSSCLKRPV